MEENKLNLNIPTPEFDSKLVELIIELETLRTSEVKIEFHPLLFFQLKEIFHMLESLQSARIEGNRTTISDYVNSKFESVSEREDIEEISNIETAIKYVNDSYDNDSNFKISNKFIKELHQLTIKDLKSDGSSEQGKYRTCNVKINKALHTPPNPTVIPAYMQELIDWINTDDKRQKLLLKVALAHHCFTWIHPFDNGNGRMSRILTYAMLRQYGFQMAYLMNSSAIFCINRDKYFEMLQVADENTDEAKLKWCEYVLTGLKQEFTKMLKLMNKLFFINNIVMPAIKKAYDLHYINDEYKKVLELSLNKKGNLIKSKDIQELYPQKTPRQRNLLINKLLDAGLLTKTEPNARTYLISLMNKDLTRGVINSLYKEHLINVEE